MNEWEKLPMFLQHRLTETLIEILSLPDLYDPCLSEVMGRSHAGEEMQDPELYPKADLIFPSGEPLPRCWLDAHYRESRSQQVMMTVR